MTREDFEQQVRAFLDSDRFRGMPYALEEYDSKREDVDDAFLVEIDSDTRTSSTYLCFYTQWGKPCVALLRKRRLRDFADRIAWSHGRHSTVAEAYDGMCDELQRHLRIK